MNQDYYIEDLVLSNKIPGMNTCVVHGNHADLKSYGYKSIFPNKEENNINTLYDVASLTKVLVTLPIICKLIDEKEISFDTKLQKILPDFLFSDVSIYDLLVHQSGLPSSINMKDKEQNRESLIKEIYHLNKSYESRSSVVYSDIGYILLGLAVEKIYRYPLEYVAKDVIFTPLNMNNTTYNPQNAFICAPTEFKNEDYTEVYRGVVHDWKARLMDGSSGHAGVFSCAYDIGNYMKMILNYGYYNNKKILSEEMINEWFKTQVYEKQFQRYRSLCWIRGNNKFIIDEKNDSIISFHGFAGPSISLDRKNHFGICLMSNSVHPLRENKDKLNEQRPVITDMIYKDYFGEEYNKVLSLRLK